MTPATMCDLYVILIFYVTCTTYATDRPINSLIMSAQDIHIHGVELDLRLQSAIIDVV